MLKAMLDSGDFIATMVGFIVLAVVLGKRVGSRLGLSWPAATGLLVALAVPVVASLTPSGSGSWLPSHNPGPVLNPGMRTAADWLVHAPSLGELFVVSDTSVNFWMMVPLGVLVGALAHRHRLAASAAVLGISGLLEVAQWGASWLGRTPSLPDVIAATMGAAFGLVIGSILRRSRRAAAKRSGGEGSPDVAPSRASGDAPGPLR